MLSFLSVRIVILMIAVVPFAGLIIALLGYIIEKYSDGTCDKICGHCKNKEEIWHGNKFRGYKCKIGKR